MTVNASLAMQSKYYSSVAEHTREKEKTPRPDRRRYAFFFGPIAIGEEMP